MPAARGGAPCPDERGDRGDHQEGYQGILEGDILVAGDAVQEICGGVFAGMIKWRAGHFSAGTTRFGYLTPPEGCDYHGNRQEPSPSLDFTPNRVLHL